MAVDRARSVPRHRARVRAVLAAISTLAVLGSLVAGPSAALGVGWRRNQSPGQRVLVWHDEKWRNGKIKTLSESKIDVGLDGATGTSVIKRRDSIDVQPAMEDRGMSLTQLERFWDYCCAQCQGRRVADPDSDALFQLEEAPTWLIVKKFVAATRNNLGDVLQNLGKLQEAKQEYEAALAIRIQRFGTVHPGVAMTCDNLGVILRDRGQLHEAKQEHEAAPAIRMQCLGTDHPEVEWPRVV